MKTFDETGIFETEKEVKNIDPRELEPGDSCPCCDDGEIYDKRDNSCYCSTTNFPPCGHCTTLYIGCNNCDFEHLESF